uniref:Uncharacterized protein n=1 Tax=viral metagenome TaxID=1070528 RepID=A0A6M3IIJ4_9ZZZZ
MADFVEKEIDYAGLKKLVTAFDKLKLIEDGKIKVDKTDALETLGQKYLDAVGKVPEDKEEALTEEMVGAFNFLRKHLEAKKKEAVKEEKAAKSGDASKQTKKKKSGGLDKKEKKESKGPSTKMLIYSSWKEKKTLPELLKKSAGKVKDSTVKAWVSAWGRKSNLPAGA